MTRIYRMVPAAMATAALLTTGMAAPVVAAPDSASIQAAPRAQKVLDVDFQYQETGYWCGPAATRIALSARMSPPSQADLAGQLGTDENGTDWIGQVTGVLNDNLGSGWYETKEMPNDPPTQAQKDLLWNDLILDIDNNYPIVANIVAPANNHPPGYPNYTICTTSR